MNPFIGEIVMFGGNFAPRQWAFCDGQLLAISSNTALFSILGTTYGGDGRTTFALPDLRSRVAVHPGHGPGLSSYTLGERGGREQVTLTQNEMPSHNHFAASNADIHVNETGGEDDPEGNFLGGGLGVYSASTNGNKMSGGAATTSTALAATGGSLPFNIEQPFLATNYIICLFGVYPSRN